MDPSKKTRALATGLVLVAFLACWRLVGPAQLGGTAHYVITHGNSMEPEYHEGDLVLLRSAGAYLKGDIVGYRSPSLDQTVLHRLHHFQDDGSFVTKGDNNSWIDTDRLEDADVIGKAWLHVPGAGKWLGLARSPAGATVLVGVLAALFLLGGEKRKGRRAKSGKGPQVPRLELGNLKQPQKVMLGAVAGVAVLLFLLAAVSFSRPLVAAITADAAYEHVGDFDYTARVSKNTVYPTGVVAPGNPVFLRLVDHLDVSFDYQLRTDTDHSIRGEALVFARVTGASGWKKTIPVARVKEFKGNRVSLEGSLDFGIIQKLSQDVQRITGVPEGAQNVEIVPRIDVQGEIAGQQIAERFQPVLGFQMDALQLQFVGPDGAASAPDEAVSAFHQTQPGEVPVSETAANRLSLLGLSIHIQAGRMVGMIGFLIALCVLFLMWRRFSNPAHADEASLIAAQYGEWLIPVETMDTSTRQNAVQVKSIDALVRLAELYERMILHEESERGHRYFIEEEGVMYYYQPKTERTAEGVPPSAPRFGNRKTREERRRNEVERLRNELKEIEAEVLRETTGPTDE